MAIAIALLVIPYWAYFGGEARVGLPQPWDWLVWMAAALLLLPLGAGLVALVLTILRKLPRFAAGMVVTGAVMIGLNWWNLPVAGIAAACTVALLGATVASLVAGGFGTMARSRQVITVVLCAVALASCGAGVWMLARAGDNEKLVQYRPPKLAPADLIQAPNPGEAGPLAFDYFTYGSGTDRRREEYGKGAKLKSRVVNAALLLKDIESWKGKWHKWYWGFGTDALPLNARVWLPQGAGPHPLVLVVHGNHQAQESSDPGYAYLGRLFASRGYVFASIDENFINGGFPAGFETKETAVRGWLLLEHLRQLREWSAAPGNPFHGKIDWERIGLMGHSRGGEAVATAFEFNRLKQFPGDGNQKFDYGFKIRALLAIAPADGQYKPAGQPRTLSDVSYLTVQGSHDADVSSFSGAQQWRRITFTPGFDGFKAQFYVYRANHGQFNTVWADDDWGKPGGWLLNRKQLLSGDEQRQVGRVVFSAFFDAALRGKKEYLPLFRDARRGAAWLPETIYVSRYQDATYQPIANFDEDYDLTTTTQPGGVISGMNLAPWKEQRTAFRGGSRDDNSVVLGWRKGEQASYTVSVKLTAAETLEFALADANEKPQTKPGKKKDEKKEGKKDTGKEEDKPPIDLTVELLAGDTVLARAPLSSLGAIYPPLRAKFVKFKLPGAGDGLKESEPALARYAWPLAGIDAAKVTAVRFRFDKSTEGVVIVDDIGVSRTPR